MYRVIRLFAAWLVCVFLVVSSPSSAKESDYRLSDAEILPRVLSYVK